MLRFGELTVQGKVTRAAEVVVTEALSVAKDISGFCSDPAFDLDTFAGVSKQVQVVENLVVNVERFKALHTELRDVREYEEVEAFLKTADNH